MQRIYVNMKKITSPDDILSSNEFEKKAAALYRSADGSKNRYAALYDAHSCNFGLNEGFFFSSPGRIEVAGNHTDHNHGKVLTAAISVDTLAFVTPSDDETVRVNSRGYEPFECNLRDLTPNPSEAGTSKALIKGIASYLRDEGFKTGGFYASVTSDVPAAAGVSSSASFELLIAEIFNKLYNDGRIGAVKKAQASQYAENVFFMKPCGLLDQSAISLGGVSAIDFSDTANPKIEKAGWPFSDLDVIVVNTGGNHADLTDEYASIRKEMEEVAALYGKSCLRDVDYKMFLSDLPELQKKTSGRALLRAMHFFDENVRVDEAVSAIASKDEEGFLKAVKESGDSSYRLLQNCYVAGDLSERIPLGIAVSSHTVGVRAVRVHGGGFAGTIIAYVDKSESENYCVRMKEIFGGNSVYKLAIREEGACYVGF